MIMVIRKNKPHVTTKTLHGDEIYEFADAVINNKPISNGSSEDALRTMQLVFQIYCADNDWQEKYNLSSDTP